MFGPQRVRVTTPGQALGKRFLGAGRKARRRRVVATPILRANSFLKTIRSGKEAECFPACAHRSTRHLWPLVQFLDMTCVGELCDLAPRFRSPFEMSGSVLDYDADDLVNSARIWTQSEDATSPSSLLTRNSRICRPVEFTSCGMPCP